MVDEQRLSQPFRAGSIVLSAIQTEYGKELYYPAGLIAKAMIESMQKPRPLGWICPRCDTVKAPHVDECDCGSGG